MSIFSQSSLDADQELKNSSDLSTSTSGGMSYTIHTRSYVRMYKRSQFNISVNCGGVQGYFSAKYRPNIFTVPVSIQGSGMVTDDEIEQYNNLGESHSSGPASLTGQYNEFYTPCRGMLSGFVQSLLLPSSKLLISYQSGQDGSDDIMNLVNDTNMNMNTNYNNMTVSHRYNYKVYYPAFSAQNKGGLSHSSSMDGRVIALQISCQDKIYNLTKRMITYQPFAK